MWTYDERGVLFKNAPVPQNGSLVAASASGPELGTILIQPGASSGQLRLHVRALVGGTRILDGVAALSAATRVSGKFELALGTEVPADTDLDDVPDLIDDCPYTADPDQIGCPDLETAVDGAVERAIASDDASDVDAGVDRDREDGGKAGNGGATGGASGTGGAGGTGGTAGTGGAGGRGGTVGTGGTGAGVVDASAADTRMVDAGVSDATVPGTDGITTDGQLRDAEAIEVARKSLGTKCFAAGECASNFCVDGICCQTSCDQPCQVCATGGTCTPVKNRPDVPECVGLTSCNNGGRCVGG